MQLSPNQLIELHHKRNSDLEIYRTRVEDAYDDLLIVGAPIRRGTLIPLRIGTLLDVQFKIRNTIREGRFTNQAIIEKRFKANIPLLQLKLLGSWEKTQDRHFLRVPVSIDALFTYTKDGQQSAPQSGLLLDLSGGGFLLRSTHDFELDDEIQISFNIHGTPIRSSAILARLIPTDIGSDYGFAFLDIPEQLRQIIIKFTFQRQILLAELVKENEG